MRLLAWVRDAWRLILGLGRRDRMEYRLQAEMRFHVEMQTQKNIERGMSPAEARRVALVEFGARQRFVEEARDEFRSAPLDRLVQDLRHAVRALWRAKSFTAAVVLTLGLGIGATTVIFSVVDHIVLRPLDYPDPGRIVLIREIVQEMRATYPSFGANASHFLEWRRRCSACGDLSLVRQSDLTLTGDGEPERVPSVRASPSLFRLLGARLTLGRAFTDDEDQPGRDRVVVVSDGFWRRRLGADPAVVGKTLTLDDAPHVVIGVLAPSFGLPKGHGLGDLIVMPKQVELYKPLALTPREQTSPGEYDYAAITRLAPGTTVASLTAALAAIERDIAAGSSEKFTLEPLVIPLEAQVLGTSGRPLLLLLAAVATVLLIVCVNLANLTIARNARRARESAVRLALGAARGRIVRYALCETLVLALVGGALGIGVAYWGLRVLLLLAPASLPRLEEVSIDGRVLVVALLVSLATGLLFGALPAVRLAATDPGESLKSGSRSVTEDRRGRSRRKLFIAAQVGLTTILLVGTGLFLSSFVRVLRVDKGFAADRVLAVDVVLPASKYPNGQRRQQFFEQVRQRLVIAPGVESAAFTSFLPLEGESQVDVLSLATDSRPDWQRPLANIRWVSPDYFATVGTPVVQGRAIVEADIARHVAVLSQRAAQSITPTDNPLGKWIVPGSNDSVSEVIGVVADVRTSSLERAASPVVYLPFRGGSPGGSILVRTAADPTAMLALVRSAIREVDPTAPVSKVRTLAQVVSASIAQRRFQLALFALFGLTALVTASIGVYGVIAGSLSRRTAEIGVRMAFGAGRGDVHRLVLREGLTPVALGLAAGIAISFVLGRIFAALLFEVGPGDPVTLGAVIAIIGVVAAVACYLPARRATGLDPAAVLRAE